MAKKFLNGYKSFSIEVKEQNDVVIEKFHFEDMRYQLLKEFVELHFLYDVLIDGSKSQRFKWAYYYYTIDFSQRTEKADGLKIKKILNYEINGKKIILIPHIDAPVRYDEVITTKDNGKTEKMEMSLFPHAAYAKGNSGLILKYESAKPWTEINWIDSETINSVCFAPGDILR